MAFSALKPCRSASASSSILLSINRNVATSTAPKLAAAASSGAIHHPSSSGVFFGPMGAVIGILGGMVGVACCIGIHTAKQQLLHSPSVQVTKKRRECVPEVDTPDAIIRSADKFKSKSFLRKVGHIQDKHAHHINQHARYAPPTTRSREAETLKSIGIRN